jgi:GT2 family glycosyltransferase
VGDRPPITVAIPTCNGARHLAEALRSIVAQEGVAFDLVVSDDRSDDATFEVVRAEAGDRARVAVNAERLGLAGNWNRCVALSATPLVAIFHQDDRMGPGHLAAHVAAAAGRPDAGLVCSAADVIDDQGRPVAPNVVERGGLGAADRTFEPGEALRAMAVANPLRCSAVTLRADAHAAAGGFDASYRYVVDWDFWLRLARRWPVAWLARSTVAIRWHSASETHRFKAATVDLDETARLQGELFARDGAQWPDARVLRGAGARRLGRAYLNRAHDALRGGDAGLARHCLGRALELAPGLLGTIARDPRLAVEMAILAAAPRAAGRWLARRGSESAGEPPQVAAHS